MAEILIKNNRAISLGTVNSEEDLKTKPGLININPPPRHGKCECCGKHISELKPFGGPGDPLVGDFTGAYLVKKFRSFGGCVGSSWECRDCIVLDEDEYHEKLGQRRESSTVSPSQKA